MKNGKFFRTFPVFDLGFIAPFFIHNPEKFPVMVSYVT